MKFAVSKLAILCCAILLVACSGPKTPQEVAQAFWKSVLENDVGDIVKYSTLTDAKQYDHFSKNWSGYTATWGKLVIEGEKASVGSRFEISGDKEKETREFTTRLIKRNDQWMVDYASTNEEVQGGVIGNLLGQLSTAGKNLSQQLGEAASGFDIQLKRMGDELDKLAKSLDSKTKKSVDKFADDLRERIEELEQSIQKALKDKDKDWSEDDKKVLNEVSNDLKQDKERLSQPSIEAIASSSKNVGQSQLRLNSLDESGSSDYKKRWRDLTKKFEDSVDDIIDELSNEDDK